MTNGKILSEKPLNVAILKDELDKIKKRDGEFGFRAQRAYDSLDFVKLTKKQGNELFKKLEDLQIPRLKDVHINKIIDVMPQTVEELKIVLQGYTLSVSKDNLNKIYGVIKEYW